MRTERRIRRFVDRELVANLTARWMVVPPPDALAAGLLDSMAIQQLIEFVRGEFGVVIEEEELVPDNFRSISALAALIDAKRSVTGGR